MQQQCAPATPWPLPPPTLPAPSLCPPAPPHVPSAAAAAPDAQHCGGAAGGQRRAHAQHGGRVRPHQGRQQQHLLARLRGACCTCDVHVVNHMPPSLPCCLLSCRNARLAWPGLAGRGPELDVWKMARHTLTGVCVCASQPAAQPPPGNPAQPPTNRPQINYFRWDQAAADPTGFLRFVRLMANFR